jgi:seryl-tRNA synthetase
MYSYAQPNFSRLEHRLFLAIQEELMFELKLPYRVVHICTGDMVTTDAEQFDIETWLPGQNNGLGEYRETHSTSNSTDFQARRLNIKYSDGQKTEYVHTLNGTALAIGRTLIGLIENRQGKGLKEIF